jgi:hypothetical protein
MGGTGRHDIKIEGKKLKNCNLSNTPKRKELSRKHERTKAQQVEKL